jgi:hypothetical protein
MLLKAEREESKRHDDDRPEGTHIMRRFRHNVPNIFGNIYRINVRLKAKAPFFLQKEEDLLFIQDDFWFARMHRCYNSDDAERLLKITAEEVSMLVLKYGGINNGDYKGIYKRMDNNPPWRN